MGCQLTESQVAGLLRAMCQALGQVLYLQVKTHQVLQKQNSIHSSSL